MKVDIDEKSYAKLLELSEVLKIHSSQVLGVAILELYKRMFDINIKQKKLLKPIREKLLKCQ